MKRKTKMVLVMVFLTAIMSISFAGTTEPNDLSISQLLIADQDTAKNKSQSGIKMVQLEALPVEEISDDEKSGLLLLREEEKLARDVYMYFQGLYTLPVFKNIPKSEQQHMDEIKFLLDRYEIADPTAGKSKGEFINPEFRKLYLTLTEKGSENLTEALKAGALIEETDIRDLQVEMKNHVDNEDIRFVFNNLTRGSENHLRAFTKILEMNGVEYKPLILEEDYYRKIVSK